MSSPSPIGPAPSLASIANGSALLQFGHSGDVVAHVQLLVGVFGVTTLLRGRLVHLLGHVPPRADTERLCTGNWWSRPIATRS